MTRRKQPGARRGSRETLFTIPAGRRVSFKTARVGVVDAPGDLLVERTIQVRCTATDEFETIKGVRRRKFVNVVPQVGYVDELWLSDAPIGGRDGSPS